MKKFKKYEFLSEEQANLFIDDLGFGIDEDDNKYPTHLNDIVKLGYLSDKFSVDVIWHDQKDKDWKDYRIKLNGKHNSHTFMGWGYSDNTI